MKNEISILIIHTGGTIGMVKDEETGSLHPVRQEELFDIIPMLNQFDCNIEFHSFSPLMDSSNMNPGYWIQMVEVIEKNYEKYDGFVILHGSDTMAYSASALSFMLENLNKPVVFTGSQLPLGMLRTDGRENLVTSIEIAAAYEEGTPVVPEVSIYFENQLLRGNRTYKFNAEHFNAFQSPNYPALADIGIDIKYHPNNILKPNFKNLRAHKELDNNVAILKLFPGISPRAVEAVISIPGLKGIVLETYGTGNAMSDRWFLDMLTETVENEIIFFNVTQCQAGKVDIGKYQTSIELGKIGVISGYDITTESAITKMMYLLGAGFSGIELKRLLVKPLRGEMTTL